MQPSQIVGLVDGLVGLVVGGLSIPLIRGTVQRNDLYGFRFKEAFASEERWLLINRYGSIRQLVCSLIVAAIGAVGVVVPVARGSVWYWVLLAAPLLLLVPCLQAYRFARSLGSTTDGPPAEPQD